MQHFPAFLRLDGRQCLVVGGGEVAARKARLLLRAGAVLTVIAPHLGSSLQHLFRSGEIRWEPREFEDADVVGNWLVISATGVPETERRIASAATAARVFCNSVDNLPDCSFITPAIIDRSPVVVAVSSGGAAPVLARQLRARIETLLPAGLGKLADIAGKWRGLVREKITDFAGRRLFWERFFDSAAAGDADPSQTIAAMLESAGTPVGMAWLVGAGPGDPELLTIRALQCMQAADVIVHDRLVSTEVLELARRDAALISVGKIPGCTAHTQEEINALLVRLVSSGKRVCRLKGGDPYIFGRGGEEVQALEDAGLSYRVVPGITAASGCAAAAGIPLTHRDAAQSVVFLTAHGKDSVDRLDWPSLARDRQTLAFYMGVRRFQDIMNKLVEHGRAVDTPIAIVERGTTTEQRVLSGTLGQLTMIADANRVVSPAMLFVGDVTRLAAGSQFSTAYDHNAGPGAPDTDAGLKRQAEQSTSNSVGI